MSGVRITSGVAQSATSRITTAQDSIAAGRTGKPTEVDAGDAADIAAITPDRFRELFRHSAVRRAGIEGLRRNALAALGSPSADDI